MPSEQKYTNEYLKNIFLDKAQELGRPPKRREIKHGSVIATRFGDGSYAEALKYFGYYKNTKSKAQIKREFEEKLQNSTCIQVYNMVLNGTLKYFPRFFWQDITDQEIVKILKYLFENILQWSIKDIKEKMSSYILPKYKLQSLFSVKFKGSPFAVVNFVYPNMVQEWKLSCTPISYWNKEKAIDVIKVILEKEKVDILTIKQPQLHFILKKYKKPLFFKICSTVLPII
ncbi:DUF4046 domain-containing protein [Clostridium botulinum D/C]|uniref:homing endonuclease associated repeat-containing protein n=2 Tax=Clostridium botulinum TaxID=1491 RepID=UPI001E65796D|nr:DUF4046 domain-containing protein [Clostridium botulinum]MCD3319511.1 DUF4046 domain-containing protein [Clostridium botulinum D/C]